MRPRLGVSAAKPTPKTPTRKGAREAPDAKQVVKAIAKRPDPAAGPPPGRPPPSKYTLKSLVAELRSRAEAGETQETLVGWLYSIASGLGIRMRYDEHRSATARAEPDDAGADDADADGAGSADGLPAPDTPEPRADADGPAARRKPQPVPYSIVKGKLVLFLDAALQEREPPASGRFDHLAEGESFVGRIILSCDRGGARADAPLCGECNGAVIDAQSWTHLVVPPRAFASRPSPREVDRALAVPDADGVVRTGHYDVIQVSDGTVVTLYGWRHPTKGLIWCLASSNGYDVSHLRWMGEKTYAELVYELMSALPGCAPATGLELLRDHLCPGDVRLGFRFLAPTRCYTVGFRHPNFHPMGADPPGIWNIQGADLATGDPQYFGRQAEDAALGIPGVPRQALYTREDIIRLGAARGRQGVGADGSAIQVADLEHISRTALEDAKAVIAKAAAKAPSLPAAAGVHVCPMNYGFVLRSRDPGATPSCADVLYDSPLLRKVRQLVYQRPARGARDDLDETTRLEFNSLRAFLTATDRDTFIALFPEFQPRFVAYTEFVDNVIHLVLHMRRQDAMAPNTRSESQPRGQTKLIARTLLNHIVQHEGDFRAFDENARSIVHDYVVRPEYTMLYLRALGLAPR